MKLYNQLTKSKEVFKPINEQDVKIYTCGPTVYSYAHIGNFTSYIYWDLLVRILMSKGYNVNRVLNITDVGHLTDDGDNGEDKLEKGARKEGKTVWDIAAHYTEAFLKDFRALNLTEPTKICKATDYIEQGINLINTLTEKGYTYETSDGIYFDTAKFDKYADFANLDIEHLMAGARVEYSSEKRNPSDFAVWKFIKDDENHAMRWDYLGRPGYPGWHLECSTIIETELGAPIDIHTGGIDHIPVHHTNEIAQSEAAFGKLLANFWLHCNFITINGEKVSKSLGNTYTLQNLASMGFSPLDFKMWVLQGHYKGERNFSFEDLAAAKKRRLNWKNRVALSYQIDTFSSADSVSEILDALEDNLNSPQAFMLIDKLNLSLDDWKLVDDIFRLELIVDDISESQKQLIAEREAARRNSDFAESDRIRDILAEQNIAVRDTATGPIWEYIS